MESNITQNIENHEKELTNAKGALPLGSIQPVHNQQLSHNYSTRRLENKMLSFILFWDAMKNYGIVSW